MGAAAAARSKEARMLEKKKEIKDKLFRQRAMPL
jgi:hypothetical protein